MEDSVYTGIPDLSTQQFASSAREIGAAGLKVSLNGDAYREDVEAGPTSQLSVKLGVRGNFPFDGENTYLVVLETPDPQTDGYDAIATAISHTSCVKLFERLAQGWTERAPSGRRRHFIAVKARGDNEFQTIVRSIPSRQTTSDEKILADLRFSKEELVAPTTTESGSYILHEGSAGYPTLVSPSELFGIGVVLDEASDTRDRLARGSYDVREHDAGTTTTRDRYNRLQSYPEVQRTLADLGWTQTNDTAFAADFSRGDESGELIKENLVFVDRGVNGESLSGSAVAYRAFDLLVGTTQGKKILGSAEAVAQWLVDHSHIRTDVSVFAARGEIPNVKSNQKTHEVATAYIETIRRAKSRLDAGTPLAFIRTVNHEPSAVISLGSSAQVLRWADSKAKGLLIAAAQYAKMKDDKDGNSVVVENLHSVPESVVDSVMEALKAPGALSPIEYLATEPIVTKDGQVVMLHGYDMAAHAFISIPHRDRSKWKREYSVPETPTVEQAQAAYEFLDTELFADFPYATERDRARHMAYILTCVGRTLTTGSIAFAADAPDRGSGKTLALMIGRILAQGSPQCQTFNFGLSNDDETRKGMATLLRSEGTFMHCDEVPRGATMKSTVVTEAITAVDGDGSIRILGASEEVTRTGLIITAAGNNIDTGGDLNRRFFNIRLAVKGGSALGRTGFRHKNLIKFVNQNRPALLAAAHTVLLFGLQNDLAHDLEPMDFNHTWAEVILGSLTHVKHSGGETVATVATRGWKEDVAAGDETGLAWGELLAHLWRKTMGKSKTCHELILAYRTIDSNAGEQKPDLPPSLIGVDIPNDNASRRWATEIKVIEGTGIPYEGSYYEITKVGQSSKSKKSARYSLERWADGALVLPGREPEQKAVSAPGIATPVAGAVPAPANEEVQFS